MSRAPALLLLEKPAGMTSFDCIRALKKAWNTRDLGHGGTLDKFATGLLPVLTGEGLKLVRFFLESHPDLPTYWKTYSGTIVLGRATETGDPEGAVTDTRPVPASITREMIAQVMDGFVKAGTYEQMPPVYSAKKIGGERASDMAREGKTPELKAVPVTIKTFTCEGFDRNGDGTATVKFRTTCSKGTYMRVLAQDLARKLDTCAYVIELRRDAVGTFDSSRAVTLEKATSTPAADVALSLEDAVGFMPRFDLLPNEPALLKQGRVTDILARLSNSVSKAGSYCAWFDGKPLALFEMDDKRHSKHLRSF